MRKAAAFIVALTALLSISACERERREFRPSSMAVAAGETGVQQSPLHPGAQDPLKAGESESPAGNARGPFESNAYAVSEGQKLYAAFNCVGCHAHGGGGI